MNGRREGNREDYLKLLDLLNEFPEFFNEGEVGCPKHVVTEIKRLGLLLFAEDEKILDLTVEKYLDMKNSGFTENYIASKYCISKGTLNRWKVEHGISVSSVKKHDYSEIRRMYDSGMTQTQIAIKLETAQSYISNILKKEGAIA